MCCTRLRLRPRSTWLWDRGSRQSWYPVRNRPSRNRLRSLGLEGPRERIKLRSAGAYLDQWFETDPIKAPIVFDGIVGTYSSPLSGRHVFPIIVAAG